MTVRLRVAGAAAAICIAVGLVLVSSAISAAPPAKPRPPKSSLKPPIGRAPAGPVAHATGGLDKVSGNFSGHITNLTPYTWTLVQQSRAPQQGDWYSPPATVRPTDAFDYTTHAWTGEYHTCCFTDWFFNNWLTYRTDTPRGTEYLTIWVNGCWTEGLANCGNFKKETMSVDVYDTTAPPYKNQLPPGPYTSNPAIGWTQGSDWGSDVVFQPHGNFTLDASTAGAQVLVAVLKVMCAGATSTTCNFTATGPLKWKLGDFTAYAPQDNVDCSTPPTGEPPPSGPPGDAADYREFTIKESREASLGAGVKIGGGVDANVFNAVEVEVVLKFGVEHEWSNTTEIDKSVGILLPRNWLGGVWTAPIVGTVTGTLVVTTQTASYTITNFTESKDGVSPDDKTPPYDVLTYTRPLTMDEWQTEKQRYCSKTASAPATDRRARLSPGSR